MGIKRTRFNTKKGNNTNIPEKKYTYPELKKMLNNRQKKFVHEYIKNGWNGTQAYIKAYPGISYNSACVNACNLLRKPYMKQYMDYTKEDYEQLCGVSKAKQVAEYYKIAYSSISKVYKDWLTLHDFEQLKKECPEALDLIESIESKTENKINEDKELIQVNYLKIKLYSKLVALAKIDELMGYKEAAKIQLTMEQPLFPES